MTEVKEDFLSVDTPIPGQNYVCLSFVSPEKVIRQKQDFYYENFINFLISEKRTEEMEKNNAKTVLEEIRDGGSVSEKYDDYMFKNELRIQEEFNKKVDFQTNTRGVKIRGVYESHRQAMMRAEQLRKSDPTFNVFVGQVGYWLPFDPEPDHINDSDFMNDKLNTLMKKKKENEDYRDMLYEEEKREKIKAANEETRRLKEQYSNGNASLDAEEVARNLSSVREAVNQKEEMLNEKKNEDSGNNENRMATAVDSIMGHVASGPASDETNNIANGLDDMDPWMKNKLRTENLNASDVNF